MKTNGDNYFSVFWFAKTGDEIAITAPDADIPQEIVCLLTQHVRAGRATFLIKVKSHRGELSDLTH